MIFFDAVLPHAFDMTALSATEIGLILAMGIGIDLAIQAIYLSVASGARSFIARPARCASSTGRRQD